jgi:hypothetical protein
MGDRRTFWLSDCAAPSAGENIPGLLGKIRRLKLGSPESLKPECGDLS